MYIAQTSAIPLARCAIYKRSEADENRSPAESTCSDAAVISLSPFPPQPEKRRRHSASAYAAGVSLCPPLRVRVHKQYQTPTLSPL